MQKKLLLLCMITGSALASRAQVEKHDWLLGGTFNFYTGSSSTSGSGSNSGSNSNISPELGWAVGKNSIIGIRGSVYFSTAKDVNGNKQTGRSYLVGAFWKKLFPINEKVGWYGDLTGGYSYANSQYPNSGLPIYTQQLSGSGFYAAISPGVYYKAGKKVLLNAGIGGMTYNYSKTNYDFVGTTGGPGSSTSSAFGINLLNYFTFGVSFILNKDRQM